LRQENSEAVLPLRCEFLVNVPVVTSNMGKELIVLLVIGEPVGHSSPFSVLYGPDLGSVS
jgi:hypothetical protein